jgi:hypothetical protein
VKFRVLRLAASVGLCTVGLAVLGSSGARAATATGTAPFTGATFVSEPGDFLGQGLSYSFPTVTYTGLRSGYPTFSVSNPTDQFDVWLAAPAGQPLVPGTYTDAERFDFRSAGFPGLDVFGDGRGCNQVVGSFTVYDATYDGNGNPLSFAAQFFDHCEGDDPALMGDISYDSSVAVPPLPATAPEPPQEAQFVSQPGDYLGEGQVSTFPIAFPFGDPNRQNPNSWILSTSSDDTDFTVDLDAPDDAPLALGTYADTTDAGCGESQASPCLSVFGEGRGCDTESGTFTIYDISDDPLGMLQSFAAEFIDHCGSPTVPALYGAIRWNSNVPMPPRFASATTATATVGTPFSFTVLTSALPVPTIKKLRKLPPGLHFVNNGNGTATLSGTPSDQSSGTYKLRFRATVKSGKVKSGTTKYVATQPFTLVVLPASASSGPASSSAGPTGPA